MDIRTLCHHRIGALIFRLHTHLVHIGLLADINIIIYKVLAQSRHGHGKLIPVIIQKQHPISHLNPHIFSRFLSQHGLPRSRVRDPLPRCRMQVQKAADLISIFRNLHINGFHSAPKAQIHALLIPVSRPVQQLLRPPIQLLLILFLHRIRKSNADIVSLNLIILHIRHIRDRILHSIAGEEQCRTAADSENHHEKPFLVPHNISDGNLVQELQPSPDEWNLFQENPFSALWRFGADQPRRHTEQLMTAGKICRTHGARKRGRQGEQRKPDIKKILDLTHAVHDAVSHPDHPGEQPGANSAAGRGSHRGSRSGIKQIFPHNGLIAIAQRLHHADLCSLLLHHTVHGGHADQSRYQEEEHRKYIGNSRHNIGITLIAGVPDISIPCKHIVVRLLDIGKLNPGIVNLCLCVRHLLLKFGPGILIFLPCIRKLDPAFLQLSLSLGKLLLGILQIPSGPGQLLPSVGKPGPALFQLLLCLGKLLLPVLKLVSGLCHLFFG